MKFQEQNFTKTQENLPTESFLKGNKVGQSINWADLREEFLSTKSGGIVSSRDVQIHQVSVLLKFQKESTSMIF